MTFYIIFTPFFMALNSLFQESFNLMNFYYSQTFDIKKYFTY